MIPTIFAAASTSGEYAIVTGLVALLCTLLGGVISYSTFVKNMKKDAAAEATKMAEIMSGVNTANAGIIEMKAELKQTNANLAEHIRIADERHTASSVALGKLDSSYKSLHLRVDRLPGNVNFNTVGQPPMYYPQPTPSAADGHGTEK